MLPVWINITKLTFNFSTVSKRCNNYFKKKKKTLLTTLVICISNFFLACLKLKSQFLFRELRDTGRVWQIWNSSTGRQPLLNGSESEHFHRIFYFLNWNSIDLTWLIFFSLNHKLLSFSPRLVSECWMNYLCRRLFKKLFL